MAAESSSRFNDEKNVNIDGSTSTSNIPTERSPAAKTEKDDDRLHPLPLHVVPSITAETEASDGLQQHTTTGTDTETYPEGGLRAWLVVFGAWCALMSSSGIMNTQAIFQAYLSTHQLSHYDEGIIGWVFSIFTFVVFFLGLYIGPMFDKHGPRLLMLAATVLLAAGLVLFSISTGKLLHPSMTRTRAFFPLPGGQKT